jgi:outer membrane lipoprotein SlyB
MIKTWIAVAIGFAGLFIGTTGGLFWGALGGGTVGGIAGVSAGAVIGACATTEIARQKGLLNDTQTLEVLNEFKDQAIKKIRSVPKLQINGESRLELDDLDCADVVKELH